MRAVSDVVGSTLTLTGAVAIGWGLHRTVWLGDLPPSAPAAVLAIGGGAALVAAGWYLESEPPVGEEREAESEAEETDEAEYDERFSPLESDQSGDGGDSG